MNSNRGFVVVNSVLPKDSSRGIRKRRVESASRENYFDGVVAGVVGAGVIGLATGGGILAAKYGVPILSEKVGSAAGSAAAYAAKKSTVLGARAGRYVIANVVFPAVKGAVREVASESSAGIASAAQSLVQNLRETAASTTDNISARLSRANEVVAENISEVAYAVMAKQQRRQSSLGTLKEKLRVKYDTMQRQRNMALTDSEESMLPRVEVMQQSVSDLFQNADELSIGPMIYDTNRLEELD
jgi:hypothetical protein